MKVLCILIAVVIACSDAYTGNYPGYPSFPGGYPGNQGGYPGYPGNQGGYPGNQGGYPGNQGGYPGYPVYPGGYPGGLMCGNAQCPNNFVCSYGTCVARQFTCPMVQISNQFAYKSCQMGCDFLQGEQCCQNVCMKGPSLVRGYGSGFSGAEKPQNSPIQSGAGKAKPVPSSGGKPNPVPSGGKAPAPGPANKPE